MGGGRLVVVATPIGNLTDLSPRARSELAQADAWLVEDTRVSARLRAEVGSTAPMRVLNDHTSPEATASYAREIAAGARWALVSDAGTPVVSDPGAALVDACLGAGVEVDVVPGPSAVLAALCVSGFYAQRFTFLGFLPRKPGPAAQALRPFAESTMTLVLFEAAPRLDSLLRALGSALGSRRVVVCRELTKRHQQVWRGTLDVPPPPSEVPRKGEITVVVEGHRNKGRPEEV